MGKLVKRKFLAARQDLVERVKQIARERNVTVYGLVNETLEQLIKADELGDSFAKIVREQQVLRLAREAGFTLVGENLWSQLLDKLAGDEVKRLSEAYFSFGEWFGKLCEIRFQGLNPATYIEPIMRAILWNVSEFKIKEESERLQIRCIGPRLNLAGTILLSEFISGFMGAYDFSVSRRSISRGIISLELSRRVE